MRKNFELINGKLWEDNSIINNKSPFSNDLKNNWINPEAINENIDSSLKENLLKNINNYFKNTLVFLEITWDVKWSIKRNLWSILWEEFSSDYEKEILEILDNEEIKKDILDLEEKIKNNSLESNNFNIFLEKIFKKIEKNSKFEKILMNFFKNNKEILDNFSWIEENIKKISENEDLEFNPSWWFNWKKSKWYFNPKNISTWKDLALWWIFAWTVSWDIAAWSRFVSPESDIASWFLDTFNKLYTNLDNWLIDWWNIALWSSFWIADLTFKILFISWVYKIMSSSDKISWKEHLKWTWLFLWMSAAIFMAWWLQWISAAASADSKIQKVKTIDSSVRWLENKENSKWYKIDYNSKTVFIKENVNNNVDNVDKIKDDVNTVLSWVTSLWEILPDICSIRKDVLLKWLDVIKKDDYNIILEELLYDIKNWEIDNLWSLWKIDKYIEQVEEIWDLKELYKRIFENVLVEIRWESATWEKTFWSIAYEKFRILLLASWYNKKWETFNNQLENFIIYIYWDSELWKKILKEITNWINLNKRFAPKRISWELKISLNSLALDYKKNNEKILIEYKEKIKIFILWINDENLDEIKISELNKIIKDFNKFISNNLNKNSENFISDINKVSIAIKDLYDEIDLENQNVSNYKEAEIEKKKLNTNLEIQELPERYIEFDDILNDLKNWIEDYKKTWEVSQSIISFADYFISFIWINYTDIAIILLLLWYSNKYWKRELKNWRILNKKELLKYKDEKFLKAKEEIFSLIWKIDKIFKEEWEKIEKSWVDIDKVRKISDFVKNFWIAKKWENFYWYEKKSNTIKSEFEFWDWKIKQVNNLTDLIINPKDFKNINKDDTIFISNFQEFSSLKTLSIIDNDDIGWTFNLELNSKNNNNWNILDLHSDYFTEILKEWSKSDSWNIKWIFEKNMLWILISKTWFVFLPYWNNLEFNILSKDDLLKYIK